MGAAGTVSFNETTYYFADRDMGDGALLSLKYEVGNTTMFMCPVCIYWKAWNEFEFVEVESKHLGLEQLIISV